MSREITITLTSEILEKSLALLDGGFGISDKCLFSLALKEADNGNQWLCGYNTASSFNTLEKIEFSQEVKNIVDEFTKISDKKSESRRWFIQRELEGKQFVLIATSRVAADV